MLRYQLSFGDKFVRVIHGHLPLELGGGEESALNDWLDLRSGTPVLLLIMALEAMVALNLGT
jgi:hypothetical protein